MTKTNKKIAIALLIGFLGLSGIVVWLGVTFSANDNKTSLTEAMPNPNESNKIVAVDPEASEAIKNFDLLKFHAEGNLLLKLWRSDSDGWTEIDELKINEKEGYLFITGGPASEAKFHVVFSDKGETFSISINDERYKAGNDFVTADVDRLDLREAQLIAIGDLDADRWAERENLLNGNSSWDKISKTSAPEGCYVITIQGI